MYVSLLKDPEKSEFGRPIPASIPYMFESEHEDILACNIKLVQKFLEISNNLHNDGLLKDYLQNTDNFPKSFHIYAIDKKEHLNEGTILIINLHCAYIETLSKKFLFFVPENTSLIHFLNCVVHHSLNCLLCDDDDGIIFKYMSLTNELENMHKYGRL